MRHLMNIVRNRPKYDDEKIAVSARLLEVERRVRLIEEDMRELRR